MKIINEHSISMKSPVVEITTATQLINMLMDEDAQLEHGELEILRSNIRSLKAVLGNMIDTLVPQTHWLKVCPIYGYKEVNDEF